MLIRYSLLKRLGEKRKKSHMNNLFEGEHQLITIFCSLLRSLFCNSIFILQMERSYGAIVFRKQNIL